MALNSVEASGPSPRDWGLFLRRCFCVTGPRKATRKRSVTTRLEPDNDVMSSAYLWVKALHLVFVASWFAGLFYLPRLFVNLAMVPADSHAERERLLLMARKLYRFSNGLMLLALGLGLWLWLGWGPARFAGSYWLHAKLLGVVAAIGYLHLCRGHLRRFEQMSNRRSHRWFRVFNEISVLLFAAIVVLAVVKPF